MSQLTDFVVGGAAAIGLASAYTTLNAGEAVALGDVIVQGADGLAYWAADPASINTGVPLRPIYNAIASYNTLQQPVSTLVAAGLPATLAAWATNSIGGQLLAACSLTNGNYAIAWVLAASPYNVQFAIINAAGQIQAGPTTVAGSTNGSSGGIAQIYLAALNGGNFAVVSLNSSGQPQYAVYSNTGAVVKANAIIEGTTGQVFSMSVCPLSNGSFAVGYFYNAGNFRYAVYDGSGAAVKSPTTVDSSILTSSVTGQVSLCALTGGGFVFAYAKLAANSASTNYFAIYTNVGAQQLAPTQFQSGTFATGGNVTAAALTGGGFAIVAGFTSVKFELSVWNSAGVQQGAAIALSGMAPQSMNQSALVPLPNGNVVFAGPSGSSTVILVNGVTGALIRSVSLTVFGSPMVGAPLGNSSVLIASAGNVTQLDQDLNIVGTVATASGVSVGAGLVPAVFQVPNYANPSLLSFMYLGFSGSLTCGILYNAMQKMVPIGVASASAAQGQPVRVQTLGGAKTRLSFKAPYAVNARPSSGQLMNVAGNLAIMNGIQATAPRNIS